MIIKTLVVDNNPVLLRAMSAILEKQGCSVQTATNGLEALNVLKEFTPDIVFTDLVMPLVGGEQLCKIIRNTPTLSEVFIVVVSGISPEDFDNILPVENYDSSIAKGTLKEIAEQMRDVVVKLEEYRAGGAPAENDGAAMLRNGEKRFTVTTELLSEKKHLSTILANLEEGIVELDVSGRVVSVNKAAVTMLGVREETFIGSYLDDYPWSAAHKDDISQWLKNCNIQAANAPFEIRDDAPLIIQGKIITASFFAMKSEGLDFTICIFRDISRQYQAEKHERELNQALSLLKKMESMSSMAGGIAHDFNNLLTVVCGNLDVAVLKKDQGISEQNYKLLKNARSAAYKVVDLTKKISCFSPFGIISRDKVQFETFVQQTVSDFLSEEDTSYTLNVENSEYLVEVDAEQIETAIGNVLQNSIEAAAGEIVINVSLKELEEPQISSGQYVPAGSYGCVEIRDNGCGIEQEHLLEIFDPYFSTKTRGAEKGMGLGLTVVYATMRNHMGYVIVESEKDKGTRVELFMPVYRNRREIDSQEGEGCEGRNLLLVEQDWQLQEIFKVMLEFIGYNVTISDSMEEGIEECRNRLHGSGEMVNVVFIDPSQHETLSSREVCDRFYSCNPSCKIIATGSSAKNPVLDNYLKFGFADILYKPYAFDEVKRVMAGIEE